IGERQGGLFDRESQRAGFAETARAEGLERLRAARKAQIEAHPDMKAAIGRVEKAQAKLEQMKQNNAAPKYIEKQMRAVEGARKVLETVRSRMDALTGDIDMSAYGQQVRTEQAPLPDLGQGSMEIGLAASFGNKLKQQGTPTPPPAGSYVPPQVAQQF